MRISLGGLKRIINNPATRSTALGVVKQIGAQALTEFTEEAATEVMNIVSDAAVMQDKAQLAQFFSEYVEAHPGKEGEAMALVAAQFVQQMTLSGLQGAISGGVMGGGATTYAGIQNWWQGRGAGRTVQAGGTTAQNAVTPQALPIAPAAQSAGNSPQDILAALNGPLAQGAAARSAAPAPQDILAALNGPLAQGAAALNGPLAQSAAARNGTAPKALPIVPALQSIAAPSPQDILAALNGPVAQSGAAQSAAPAPQDILAALNGPVAQGAVARNGTAPQALPVVPALQSIAAPSPQDILAALNGPVAQSAGAELQSRLAELNGPVAQGAAARNGTAPQALPIVPTLNKMIDFEGKYFTMGNEGAGGFAEQGGINEQGGVMPQELPVANAGDTTGAEGSAKWKDISTESANNTNKTFPQGYEPPYKPETQTKVIELTQTTKPGEFVRVYDNINSGQAGGWIMRAEDVVGLTPQQIQSKFALLTTPTHITDVIIESGTQLRTGTANGLFGFEGGGTQFDMMGQYAGQFVNGRPLP